MAKKKNESNLSLPTKTEVQQFEMIYPMIVADLNELRELSKKKPDGLLNTLKVKTINKKLEKIKSLLLSEPTTEFLELLDEDTLPSNSDAVFLVIQFKTALEQYKSKYYVKVDKDDEWSTLYEWETKD
jgi:hypothetical protein